MMPELGFNPIDDNDRRVASYSGGWQMRMCLGKMLLKVCWGEGEGGLGVRAGWERQGGAGRGSEALQGRPHLLAAAAGLWHCLC